MRSHLRLAPPLLALGVVLGLLGPASPADAAFGGPILSRAEALVGVTTRQFKRDVYSVESGKLLNPGDTWGYVGIESRLGLWDDRLDLGVEVGRSHNRQDRFPDRDYLTWDLGFTLRGLIYREGDGPVDVAAGIHFRDTVAFDRSPTLAHKLQRNYAAFLLLGRRATVGERPLRLYAGPLYSRHVIEEYRAGEDPAEGETRSNLEIMGGVSARIFPALEATGEIELRDHLSFGLSAGFVF